MEMRRVLERRKRKETKKKTCQFKRKKKLRCDQERKEARSLQPNKEEEN